MDSSHGVPDESAWYGYGDDLDVKYLHGLFFGKSIAEVQQYFGDGRSIERMGELLFAPRPVFRYYVHAFGTFVTSDKAAGDSDSASCFLSLLEEREKQDPGSVREVFNSLATCIARVADNQAHYDAAVDIYGDFKERAARLRRMCGA